MSWRMKRTVAVALLLYALADLAVPGFCHGDDTIPPLSPSNPVQTVQVEQRDGELPTTPPAADMDNCFCCSWHTMPSVATMLAAPIDVAIANLFPSPVYFRLLADPFFHPPRG